MTSRVLPPAAARYLLASPWPTLLRDLAYCPLSAAALVFGSAIKGERAPRDLDVLLDLPPDPRGQARAGDGARLAPRALPPAIAAQLSPYLTLWRRAETRLDLFLAVEGTVFRPNTAGWVWVREPRGDAIASKARLAGLPFSALLAAGFPPASGLDA
jgi:hypothetical protein